MKPLPVSPLLPRGAFRCVSLLLVLTVVGGVGCGPEALWPEGAPELGAQEQALEDFQILHLSDNGLSVNGLSVNGLSVNGLSVNGLSLSALSALSFRLWFDTKPYAHDELMRYVIYCAVPQGESRSYFSLTTLRTYTWVGGLGLAPNWAYGSTATLEEQQVVSACLAAHTNPYQQHVPISVLGLKGDGTPMPIAPSELTDYETTEACFFGNLFAGGNLYAGNDRAALAPEESTSRSCALSSTASGVNPECPPVLRVGACEALSCTMDADSLYYTQCTYGGVTYRPITTRIRAVDLNVCGDGICQKTESCGTGTTANSCLADCGACL
ncbi:hypothetical protein [Hyalangium rubrum]|uniref:Lipoprotein n=1 Tax=Hyalangium rubrum TaxID=3103134 RepID=A0ABU5HAA5_9BACT|nr:hypothetical protein [Hyalangium sp. s54d21]MDY7230176.1 hypothetical protein [Hyalangium sp. s54d21]